jgi:hypothetical protein
MSDTHELPPLPQAVDVTPVSWSNLFSADQMREYAIAAINADREQFASAWEEAHGFDKWGVAARVRDR